MLLAQLLPAHKGNSRAISSPRIHYFFSVMLPIGKPTVAAPIPPSRACSLRDAGRISAPLFPRQPLLVATEEAPQQQEEASYSQLQQHCAPPRRKRRHISESKCFHHAAVAGSVPPSRTSVVQFCPDTAAPGNLRALGDTSPLSSSPDLTEFQQQLLGKTNAFLLAAKDAKRLPVVGRCGGTTNEFNAKMQQLSHAREEKKDDEWGVQPTAGGPGRQQTARVQLLGPLFRICLQFMFLLFQGVHEVAAVCWWQTLGWSLWVFSSLCCRCTVFLHLLSSGVSREVDGSNSTLVFASASLAKLLHLSTSLLESSEASVAAAESRTALKTLSSRRAAVQTAAQLGCVSTAMMRHLKDFFYTKAAAAAWREEQQKKERQQIYEEGSVALTPEEALATGEASGVCSGEDCL